MGYRQRQHLHVVARESQKVLYRGVELWVLPVTKNHYPGVALNRAAAMPRQDAERLIMQFLSALSWIENGGVLVEHFTGGPQPRPMGRQQTFGFSIQDDFDFFYLPEPSSEKAQLALAIMREGRGLNHPAYAFLSFYRVLEVAFEDGRKRGQWMTSHIDQLQNQRAKEVIAQLRAANVDDVGVHLQKSGRQAIAHAAQKPIINPDDPADARRLSSELPLIGALAELAIEDILGVETRQTVWRNHFYELSGFKKLLGDGLVAAAVKGEPLDAAPVPDIPAPSVELRRQKPYAALANLQPRSLEQNGSVITLLTQSVDQHFAFRCHLDFAAERLHFDLDNDLRWKDDGTAGGAAMIAEIHRFIRDYFGNGELRIIVSDTGELLSRKDSFIPMNCYLDVEACNANIQQWVDLAEKRAAGPDRNGIGEKPATVG